MNSPLYAAIGIEIRFNKSAMREKLTGVEMDDILDYWSELTLGNMFDEEFPGFFVHRGCDAEECLQDVLADVRGQPWFAAYVEHCEAYYLISVSADLIGENAAEAEQRAGSPKGRLH